MNFEYYPVGKNDSEVQAVTSVDLAAYVMTEWIPDVPASVINSFGEILQSVLNVDSGDRDKFWRVNRDLAFTDRQWKGMTSWIIGVAFARRIIELERYPFGCPVSAFRSTVPGKRVRIGNWLSTAPVTAFQVEKTPLSKARLLPDYVAGRILPSFSHEFAFVEAKGSTKNVAILPKVPDDWHDQVRSADLLWSKVPVAVSRHLVIATRVNPGSRYDHERMVAVRAWNSSTTDHLETDIQFAHFLANHYAGLCWRLGLDELAEILQAAGIGMLEQARSSGNRAGYLHRTHIHGQTMEELMRRFDNLPFFPRHLHHDGSLQVLEYDSPRQASLRMGERSYAAALTPAAWDIVRAIVSQRVETVKGVLIERLSELRELNAYYSGKEEPRIRVLLNGIAVYAQE